MKWLDPHTLVVLVVLVLATVLVILGKLTPEWIALVGTIYVAAHTVPARVATPVTQE